MNEKGWKNIGPRNAGRRAAFAASMQSTARPAQALTEYPPPEINILLWRGAKPQHLNPGPCTRNLAQASPSVRAKILGKMTSNHAGGIFRVRAGGGVVLVVTR